MDLSQLIKIEYILAFATFIVPGFIVMKIIRLKVPNKDFFLKDMIFEAFAYSLINLALVGWIPFVLLGYNYIWFAIVTFILVLIVAPVLSALMYTKFISSKMFQNNFNIQMPTAWDWYFSKRPNCLVRVYLKDGNEILGYFSENSYATSFPNHGDIYLEKVYNQSIEGLSMIEKTDGVLISKDSYSLIEFYKID